ncbi:myotubularin-related protein 8 [Plakobranchus ocellatus]|uniref:Myotubularin-related protein 8 n=1 Tax=Plakobranchus ocellatus TaxID=259542 RepID=A0AAV4AS68_9GAST|nr:myotubularin-related protein 8 [Plakobranchus ocellatus]
MVFYNIVFLISNCGALVAQWITKLPRYEQGRLFEDWGPSTCALAKILHMHMGQVEKLTMTAEGCPLLIRCKNFLCITFILPRERDCQDIYLSLLQFSKPAEISRLYAFNYTSNESLEKPYGWDMFDLQSEFMRMGAPNQHWVITNLNSQYELCDTYPSLLYVPASATTPVLVGSSKFRSRGRLPVLSYMHIENHATLTRCSQPLSGFSARCVEDEQMLQAILKANPGSGFMYVVDTRPKWIHFRFLYSPVGYTFVVIASAARNRAARPDSCDPLSKPLPENHGIDSSIPKPVVEGCACMVAATTVFGIVDCRNRK